MAIIQFLPFVDPPADRDGLMRYDRYMCEDLKAGDQFARPCIAWEMPDGIPNRETCNVTIVRKITDDERIRGYISIPKLDLRTPRPIEIPSELCLLCGAPSVYSGVWKADEIGPRYFETGGTHRIKAYALCQRCFDLPDKVEKVETKLGSIS